MSATPDSPPDPDAVLMSAAREGDEEAFRQLFRKHAPRLVGYVDRFFHNRALSEEIVQEVFIKVWRARRRYEPRSRFTTWLYTIASRTCLNELRRGHHRHPAAPLDEGLAPPDGARPPRPDEQLEGAQANAVVEAALAGMPAGQRQALLLTRFGGHSYTEAAALLGVSESALKSLVFRAARAIRGALDGVESTAADTRTGSGRT